MGKLTISSKQVAQDTLRVNLNKGKINLTSNLFKYRDRDTRQIVYYIASLDVTGYGTNEKKAMEMLKFSVEDFFSWLSKLPHKQIDEELKKLGWKHVQYKNKEYSQSYVDGAGQLHNFNAVGNEVERLTVQA